MQSDILCSVEGCTSLFTRVIDNWPYCKTHARWILSYNPHLNPIRCQSESCRRHPKFHYNELYLCKVHYEITIGVATQCAVCSRKALGLINGVWKCKKRCPRIKPKKIPEGIIYSEGVVKPDDGYCNYKVPHSQGGQCSKSGVIAKNGSIWCAEHAKVIEEIRSYVDHTGSETETKYRLEELNIRKDADLGHQYYYVSQYIKKF
jgi:hypothetical protein